MDAGSAGFVREEEEALRVELDDAGERVGEAGRCGEGRALLGAGRKISIMVGSVCLCLRESGSIRAPGMKLLGMLERADHSL